MPAKKVQDPAVGTPRSYANRRRGKKGGVAEESAYSREEAEKETEAEIEETEEETDQEPEEDALDYDEDELE